MFCFVLIPSYIHCSLTQLSKLMMCHQHHLKTCMHKNEVLMVSVKNSWCHYNYKDNNFHEQMQLQYLSNLNMNKYLPQKKIMKI